MADSAGAQTVTMTSRPLHYGYASSVPHGSQTDLSLNDSQVTKNFTRQLSLRAICPSFGLTTMKPGRAGTITSDSTMPTGGGNQASQGSLVDVKVQWEHERENIRVAILRAVENDAIDASKLPPEESGGDEFLADAPKDESEGEDVESVRILNAGTDDSGSESDDSPEAAKKNDEISTQIKFIKYDLTENSFHKDFTDPKFWLKLAQRKMNEKGGGAEAVIDYLRNGLRQVPLCAEMIYNFAVANERVGNDAVAVQFFRFASMVKLNWTDALFGEAVATFKLRRFKDAARCIEKANRSHKGDALEDKNVMKYFQAMCYKKLRMFKFSKRDYCGLSVVFETREHESILHFIIGLILLPITDERRKKFDYLENLLTLLKHFQEAAPKDERNVLSKYVDRTGYFDMDDWGAVLINILKKQPFFRRFDTETLREYLGYGKPQYFKKDDIIFLDGRVGIITHGSVRIKSHSGQILEPIVEAKYGCGKILGHDSDNGITTNP